MFIITTVMANIGFLVAGFLIGIKFGRNYENYKATDVMAKMINDMPVTVQIKFFTHGLKKYRKLDDEQTYQELKRIFATRGLDYDQFKESVK